MPIRRTSPSRKGSSNSHRSLPQKKKKPVRKTKSTVDDSAAGEKKEVTVLCPAAMENLYYIAHSAVDALEIRGFGWENNSPKKKKKGKKGKKK